MKAPILYRISSVLLLLLPPDMPLGFARIIRNGERTPSGATDDVSHSAYLSPSFSLSASICVCQSNSRTAIGFSRQFSATFTNNPK